MKLRYYSMIRNGFYDSVDVVMVSLEGSIRVYYENIPLSRCLGLSSSTIYVRSKELCLTESAKRY